MLNTWPVSRFLHKFSSSRSPRTNSYHILIMGNAESHKPVSKETFLERIFTDAGMGVPWAGAHDHLVVSIDIGATHTAVVVAYLQPSISISGKVFAKVLSLTYWILEVIPTIYRISHWPDLEQSTAKGQVPSILQYSSTSEVSCALVYDYFPILNTTRGSSC